MRLRYAVAQAIILVAWALDWYRRGVSDTVGETPYFGPLLSLGLFAGLPALIVGLLDGIVGGHRRASRGRRVTAFVLVVALALLISWVGIETIYVEHGFINYNGILPSAQGRVGVLIAMEVIFLLELGIASTMRRLFR